MIAAPSQASTVTAGALALGLLTSATPRAHASQFSEGTLASRSVAAVSRLIKTTYRCDSCERSFVSLRRGLD